MRYRMYTVACSAKSSDSWLVCLGGQGKIFVLKISMLYSQIPKLCHLM